MKERPILFSAPMVRAILEGRKTQTRRVVKPQPSPSSDTAFVGMDGIWRFSHPTLRGPVSHEADDVRCPYGQTGDRLWVREAWSFHPDFPESTHRAIYRADAGVENDVPRWRPSIHMPRWASRILLEITAVRVERLQCISFEEAINEGVYHYAAELATNPKVTKTDIEKMIERHGSGKPQCLYAQLWESINGAGSWGTNPWVWVVEFKRVEGGAA